MRTNLITVLVVIGACAGAVHFDPIQTFFGDNIETAPIYAMLAVLLVLLIVLTQEKMITMAQAMAFYESMRPLAPSPLPPYSDPFEEEEEPKEPRADDA